MENEVFKSDVFRKKYYLSEFQLFDGVELIIFNIVDINTEGNEITVAVTDRGKISVKLIPYLGEYKKGLEKDKTTIFLKRK